MVNKMNVIVIGLGSMGKRRIRCLKQLGFLSDQIAGFDPREDRRNEATALHGINTFSNFEEAIEAVNPERYIISVPPAMHHIYMKDAIERNIPFFVEASVVDTDMEQVIAAANENGVVAAPSSTLRFHPAIQKIGEIIASGRLGKLSAVNYVSGQYLPDWHTYEAVSDYYVSQKDTGGGREIVPFELTWLVDVFGFPNRVSGLFRKTIEIEGAEDIDDTYSALLDYGSHMINLTVDVVSRYATRRMLINGSDAQLRWDWDDNAIFIYSSETDEWEKITYEMLSAEDGYNANIGENMYIEEIRAFLDAADGKVAFVNTLEKDHKVLKLLYAIEESDKTSSFININF